MAPGYGRPFLVNLEDLMATEQKMRRQEQLFDELIAILECKTCSADFPIVAFHYYVCEEYKRRI
jgi:hypothetical protein